MVNVTAGLDLTMGEFEEVGEIVKSFASENATFVVGMVTDPAVEGEVRVTVVATGIDGLDSRAKGDPEPERGKIREAAPLAVPVSVAAPVVNTLEEAPQNWKNFDSPTAIRKPREQQERAGNQNPRVDYLDIPAFLRRQAD